MLSLKYGKLSESEKNPSRYGLENNKRILKGLEGSLPELMNRNLKLGQDLQNKITVSSFMNDTELKTKKYLSQFLMSSTKRVKDIKTGLSLSKVVKKGTENLVPICNRVDNDIIIKNSDFLLKEKNLISQKIAEERHEKINELIKKIKYIIKPSKLKKKSNSYKTIRSMPEDQILKVKKIIDNQLANDENLFNKKIGFYKKNLMTLAENRPRKFYKIASHLYLKSNLKLINYVKPKVAQAREQKILNILKIRKHLMNSKKEKKKTETDEMLKKMSNDFNNKENDEASYKKDTIIVIKNLAKEKNNLELKTKKNMRRINSMIDIKLPYFSSYHRTIKYCKKFKKNISVTTEMEGSERNRKKEIKFKRFPVSTLDIITNEIKNLTLEKIKKGCEDIERKKQMSVLN